MALHAHRLVAAVFMVLTLAACAKPERDSSQQGQQVGPACDRSKGDLCLAIKYVAYSDGEQSSVSAQDALENIRVTNDVWKQCRIQFMIENYLAFDPTTMGLNQNPVSLDEISGVRATLEDPITLLVVSTWSWSGQLGQGEADAWTTLPPVGPFGVVLNQNVATYSMILAHELGHYLGLPHASNNRDVMNPVIYTDSNQIDSNQCNMARSIVNSNWKQALRG